MNMFWWPTLQKDVRDFVQSCHECKVVAHDNAVSDCGKLSVLSLFQTFLFDFTG